MQTERWYDETTFKKSNLYCYKMCIMGMRIMTTCIMGMFYVVFTLFVCRVAGK
tara:strand:+ start:1389 stop:1547 length:159 start_codon:yes stop_codon:yes gene_type:complete